MNKDRLPVHNRFLMTVVHRGKDLLYIISSILFTKLFHLLNFFKKRSAAAIPWK